jgi:hypothetical protein
LEQLECKQPSRRRLLAVAGLSTVALLTRRPLVASTSFGPVKQIEAGDLSVAYVEAGPSDAPAIILLHGWPYDIYS